MEDADDPNLAFGGEEEDQVATMSSGPQPFVDIVAGWKTLGPTCDHLQPGFDLRDERDRPAGIVCGDEVADLDQVCPSCRQDEQTLDRQDLAA